MEIWLRNHQAKIPERAARLLRIAFLTPEFVTELTGEGGLATYTNRMTQVLKSMGHEPEVFTIAKGEPKTIDYKGVLVERIGIREAHTIRWLRCLSRLHHRLDLTETIKNICIALNLAKALAIRDREKPFDFVHCSDYGLTGLFLEKRTDIPILTRCCWARDLFTAVDRRKWTLDNWLMNFLERLSIRNADVAYAPSRFVVDYMWQKHKIKLEVLRPPFFLE